MKTNLLAMLLFVVSTAAYAQKNETTYTTVGQYKPGNEKESYDSKQERDRFFHQYELNTSLIGNTQSDNPSTSYDESRPWFIPNGLGFKYGIGVHKDKWFALSAHTGIDWKANERLVAVPVYGNISLNPLLGDDTRLVLQAGLGRGFAIGRGNMQGKYQKYTLGLESDNNDIGIFIEVSSYNFKLHQSNYTELFNIGGYVKVF